MFSSKTDYCAYSRLVFPNPLSVDKPAIGVAHQWRTGVSDWQPPCGFCIHARQAAIADHDSLASRGNEVNHLSPPAVQELSV